jgi:hypothetical protein
MAQNGQLTIFGSERGHRPLRGYPRLAEVMSHQPELMIFRRFSTIAILNILRLQAELQDLEQELLVILAENDRSSDQEIISLCEDFNLMREKLDEGGESEQIEQLQKVGQKLEEYSTFPYSNLLPVTSYF